MTEAQMRSFAERKLKQLQMTPLLSRDKHAFTAWMNSITNDILRGETTEDFTPNDPEFVSFSPVESNYTSIDLNHGRPQEAAMSSSTGSQLSANQKVRFATVISSSAESTTCLDEYLRGPAEQLKDHINTVSATAVTEISIAADEDDVGNCDIELSTSSCQTMDSIGSDCSVQSHQEENVMTTDVCQADNACCDGDTVASAYEEQTEEEYGPSDANSSCNKENFPHPKIVSVSSQLNDAESVSDINPVPNRHYDDLSRVPRTFDVAMKDIELNLSGNWHPSPPTPEIQYYHGLKTFPPTNRQKNDDSSTWRTTRSQLSGEAALKEVSTSSLQNSNYDSNHRLLNAARQITGKKGEHRYASADTINSLLSTREPVNRSQQNHTEYVDLSHITFQVRTLSSPLNKAYLPRLVLFFSGLFRFYCCIILHYLWDYLSYMYLLFLEAEGHHGALLRQTSSLEADTLQS